MQLRRELIKVLVAVVLLFAGTDAANAQIYGKMNALYACVGLINPQVEFRLSDHSTFQTELVVSPWKKIAGNHHMLFGIFDNEYRYYFRQSNSGFYVAADAGLFVFDMSKIYWKYGGLRIQNRYCKGYGYILGASFGYEYQFRERWLLDAFIGFGYHASWYNGYSMDGTLHMTPQGHEWDPFNGSAEWIPDRIGLSIGYRLFDPRKH